MIHAHLRRHVDITGAQEVVPMSAEAGTTPVMSAHVALTAMGGGRQGGTVAMSHTPRAHPATAANREMTHALPVVTGRKSARATPRAPPLTPLTHLLPHLAPLCRSPKSMTKSRSSRPSRHEPPPLIIKSRTTSTLARIPPPSPSTPLRSSTPFARRPPFVHRPPSSSPPSLVEPTRVSPFRSTNPLRSSRVALRISTPFAHPPLSLFAAPSRVGLRWSRVCRLSLAT